ncbi:MAG TPA: hypothetical protein VL177_20245, partial [Terriglobales bacterium]|nr:hypothetical protein [Terriglobales bacterium]
VHMTYTYFEPVLRFLPPLTITQQQIDRAIGVLDDAIKTALAGGASLDSVLATNPYSREFIEKLSRKRTLRRMASRLYESSPKYWIQKMTGK